MLTVALPFDTNWNWDLSPRARELMDDLQTEIDRARPRDYPVTNKSSVAELEGTSLGSSLATRVAHSAC